MGKRHREPASGAPVPLTKQLLLFVDVVQQGSFNKAAALHEMDNSFLSKQIKKLETELGVQLLNRSTRSFSLTPAGEDILRQAKMLSDTLAQVQSIADAHQSEPKGTLKITSASFFGQQYLQPVITQFIQRFPDVKITLSLDDHKTDIISDHFDLAFRVGKLKDSSLIARKIAKTNFALVASKAFIARHGSPQTPEELFDLPAVVYSNDDVSLDLVRMSEQPKGQALKDYKMKGNLKVSDVRTLIAAVADGLGFSLIDLSNLEQPIDQLGLKPLLTNHHLSTMDTGIYTLYPHRKQTLLANTFIQAVQDYIGEPAFWEQYIPNYHKLYK
nr:LysR family transcriptional regulator [Shewanella gelidii]